MYVLFYADIQEKKINDPNLVAKRSPRMGRSGFGSRSGKIQLGKTAGDSCKKLGNRGECHESSEVTIIDV